jgi:tetratricopeptide (TPR) repeat protein/NAD-dependent SIR2 family protein deacetylase
MSEIPRASVKQLAYKIKGIGKHPRFAFFLGAGASKQSGVITASEMISFFKARIVDECCDPKLSAGEKEHWLGTQEWLKRDGSEYCKYFEQVEPKEIGRQRYIESIIEGQEPSFGYMVLANLMASNYINTIITTNFDDLVYGACTSFTGMRPIVYAYGVLASEMRITAQRPKILKLHGDYLYSTLKNTGTETAVQDPNMSRQLAQVLNEYGLVVVGYGGEDKSVMEILGSISDKNDLYWCVLRGTQPNKEVARLMTEKRGFIVEIDGFDEMMNEIRQIVGFDARKMFESIQERQDHMVEKLKDFASYSSDILSETAAALQSQAEQSKEQIRKIEGLAYFAKGLQAHESGALEEAANLYRKAIEFDPSDPFSYYNLGIVLHDDVSRSAEAEAAYRKALELDPNDSDTYGNLGIVIARDESRRIEAEAALRKAIELNPTVSPPYYHLGLLLAKDGSRNAEAEVAFRKVIELDPGDPDAYNELGLVLRADDSRLEEAEATLRKAIEISPNDAVAYYNLGNLLYLDDSRSAEAEAAYRKSQELDPTDADACGNMGIVIARDESRRIEAEAALRKAIELNPTSSIPYYHLGLLLARDRSRRAEAEAAFRRVIELEPEDSDAYNELGIVLAEDDSRYAEAEAAYRRALQLDPGDVDVYDNLITLLDLQHREPEALVEAERLLKLDNENQGILIALASIQKKLGNENESMKYSTQARSLIEPDDWYDLACIEAIDGNPDAALENLKRALQIDLSVRDWARRDPDLEWIRDDPRFKQILDGKDESDVLSAERRKRKQKTKTQEKATGRTHAVR